MRFYFQLSFPHSLSLLPQTKMKNFLIWRWHLSFPLWMKLLVLAQQIENRHGTEHTQRFDSFCFQCWMKWHLALVNLIPAWCCGNISEMKCFNHIKIALFLRDIIEWMKKRSGHAAYLMLGKFWTFYSHSTATGVCFLNYSRHSQGKKTVTSKFQKSRMILTLRKCDCLLILRRTHNPTGKQLWLQWGSPEWRHHIGWSEKWKWNFAIVSAAPSIKQLLDCLGGSTIGAFHLRQQEGQNSRIFEIRMTSHNIICHTNAAKQTIEPYSYRFTRYADDCLLSCIAYPFWVVTPLQSTPQCPSPSISASSSEQPTNTNVHNVSASTQFLVWFFLAPEGIR